MEDIIIYRSRKRKKETEFIFTYFTDTCINFIGREILWCRSRCPMSRSQDEMNENVCLTLSPVL